MNYCSKCGLAVIFGVKACLCEAPIIAEMKAVTSGKGGAKTS